MYTLPLLVLDPPGLMVTGNDGLEIPVGIPLIYGLPEVSFCATNPVTKALPVLLKNKAVSAPDKKYNWGE